MSKFFHIAFLIIFFIGCTSNTIIEKPKNLIPKDKMVDLITDMLLASGGDNIKNINLERNVNYFPFVFEKHNIDTIRFKESNYYYTSKIDDYDEILGKVEKRLKALKQQCDDEIKRNDSIKRDSLKALRKKNLKVKTLK